MIVGCTQVGPAAALDTTKNRPTPDSDPYIQDMLRRTEEKRDERREQRLKDYYKRNFKVCGSTLPRT